MKKKHNFKTPSEFYRIRRPYNFSDSQTIREVQLPKEVLAFELEKITTNQKENDFETLCRKLAEKLIAPNLIPQVGPTGGGDGKTDTETYPVSDSISQRWFIPENGWDKDEKWAFAISAKKTWKSKAKSDIKKIIETERDYTKIYFMTNQCPSSKKKKDAQDEFKKEFSIDVVILDGLWIIEKVYSNNLINLVINSLNMSQNFLTEKKVLGKNDADRIKRLDELEEQINTPNRYFELDFQLIEDCLEAAILTRMIEKPRDEVEGKFDRVRRFCEKMNFNKQWIRYHYQRAWTYLNWYDDYELFIEQYLKLKSYISSDSSISEVELYFNLFNLLRGITSQVNLSDFNIELSKEESDIILILKAFESNKERPCSLLIAKTQLNLIQLINQKKRNEDCSQTISTLSNIIKDSLSFFEYPFESFQNILQEMGDVFADNDEFDILIDTIASVAEQRSSELSAGEVFLQRAANKFINKLYKDSVIYFGKSVKKLAKEETPKGLYLALKGLGYAYKKLGLIYASHNCFVSIAYNSFKTWFEKGQITEQAVQCIKLLAEEELLIGRIPIFLSWYEMYLVLSQQINLHENENNMPIEQFFDGCLSTRLLNTDFDELVKIDYLPDLLEKFGLFLACDSVLLISGYSDKILSEVGEEVFSDENELIDQFSLLASQPFRHQMLFDTNFINNEHISFSSTILGCKFVINFESNIEMILAAETILAFFEGFLATCFLDICPNKENVTINLIHNDKFQIPTFTSNNSNCYNINISNLKISNEEYKDFWDFFIKLSADIVTKHFIVKDDNKYLQKLFEEEEIHERLSLTLYHRNFTFNVLGEEPKFNINDWNNENLTKYPLKSESFPELLITDIPIPLEESEEEEEDIELHRKSKFNHRNMQFVSIINEEYWSKAGWVGFGFIEIPGSGFGLMLSYKSSEYAIKIFDDWIDRFGHEDRKGVFQITIIRGIDKHNPHWYRVQISSNIEQQDSNDTRYITFSSRIHTMTPTSSHNIDYIINSFNKLKQFILLPTFGVPNSKNFHPFIDKGILIKNLKVIQAWEIGMNDIERAAIVKGDNPILPSDKTNVPVLQVLEHLSRE
ncbi:MAG: hypothetical protein JW866_10870 [Ignavibacteriales bacterium]|nr:hypothetical protein [Ignavibacteriales bacterium]